LRTRTRTTEKKIKQSINEESREKIQGRRGKNDEIKNFWLFTLLILGLLLQPSQFLDRTVNRISKATPIKI
jgi:hypothetical protein